MKTRFIRLTLQETTADTPGVDVAPEAIAYMVDDAASTNTVTKLRMLDGESLYVIETRDEIIAKITEAL